MKYYEVENDIIQVDIRSFKQKPQSVIQYKRNNTRIINNVIIITKVYDRGTENAIVSIAKISNVKEVNEFPFINNEIMNKIYDEMDSQQESL